MITCDGNLITTQTGEYLCEGNWLQVNVFEFLFSTPTTAEIQTAFMAFFGLPLIAYLSAWAYGVVLRFINKR